MLYCQTCKNKPSHVFSIFSFSEFVSEHSELVRAGLQTPRDPHLSQLMSMFNFEETPRLAHTHTHTLPSSITIKAVHSMNKKRALFLSDTPVWLSSCPC